MLSRTRRISKTEFKELGRGMSYHSLLVSLSVYKKPKESKNLSISQFAFLCSKKVSKSAVKRNLLRRRGYASVEKVIDSIQPGYFFVFSYKKGAEGATYKDISEQIGSLLGKAGALK